MFLAPKIHFNKLLCCSTKLNANIQLCIHLFIDVVARVELRLGEIFRTER